MQNKLFLYSMAINETMNVWSCNSLIDYVIRNTAFLSQQLTPITRGSKPHFGLLAAGMNTSYGNIKRLFWRRCALNKWLFTRGKYANFTGFSTYVCIFLSVQNLSKFFKSQRNRCDVWFDNARLRKCWFAKR